MKQGTRLQYYALTFTSIIAFFAFASPIAAQSCGDFVFEEIFVGELYVERYPFEDCDNPFNVDSPAPFDYSLNVYGEAVEPGETVRVASGTQIAISYNITGSVTEGYGPNWNGRDFELWRKNGNDYYFVFQQSGFRGQSFAFDTLESGEYIAVLSYSGEPILQGWLPRWLQMLLEHTVLPLTAFAQFFPDYQYIVTVPFIIEVEEPQPEGASSVLFLPGIKASRLYMEENGSENQLWNPSNDTDVLKLSMDSTGASINDVYTGDIIESVFPFEFYKDFLSELKALKDAFAIKDYQPFAYDWRYSVFDVATMDIPYPNGEIKNLKEEVERLAAESYTGKVTLIGHSNGGLVAKALLHEYGDNELAGKVDKIIMVGTPQLGTPQAIGSLLHGYEEALGGGLITSAAATREAIKNMPGAFGLLPTNRYFAVTDNEAVVTTDGSTLTAPIRSYGDITTSAHLKDFLLDSQSVFPVVSNINNPQSLNETILNSTLQNQSILDEWTPPEGVEVFEVVGTGLGTIKRFDYRSYSCAFASCSGGKYVTPYPILTNYGDGVVVGNSAEGFDGYKKTFFIDLYDEGEQFGTFTKNHSNLTESDSVQEFIISAIKYPYLTDTLVSGEFSSITSRYTIVGTHSPVTVRASSQNGKVGLFNGEIVQDIPGSKYFTLGESTYLVLPSEESYNIEVIGTGSGVFSLTIEQLFENDTLQPLTFLDGATTTPTMVSTFTLNNREVSNLAIDYENDGVVDIVQTPNGEIIAPEPTEPVVYSYDDLETVVNKLTIKKSYKTLLVVQMKLAEKFSKKNSAVFSRLENAALQSLLSTIKAYNKKNILSVTELAKLESIIIYLIN